MDSLATEDLVRAGEPRAPFGRSAVHDLRAYLRGDWMISRLILDRRAGQRGSLLGWGVFLPDGDALAYHERGEMRLGDYRGLVSRAYWYDFVTPQHAAVQFTDGRPFHELDLSTGEAEVLHLCGQDSYSGRFAVLGVDAWSCVWTITGPRKDAVIASRYLRTDCRA